MNTTVAKRIECVYLPASNPCASADWYVRNLGLTLLRPVNPDSAQAQLQFPNKQTIFLIQTQHRQHANFVQTEGWEQCPLTIEVENLEEVYSAMSSGGVKVGPIEDNKGCGKSFYAYDPDGTKIDVWGGWPVRDSQPHTETRPAVQDRKDEMEASMEKCGGKPLAPGARPAVVMWDLNARNSETIQRFYGGLFDWEVSEPSSDRVKLAMVACGEGGINGVIGQAPTADEEGARPSGLIVYVKVDDVASYLARAEQLGGKRIWGPTEVAPGLILAHFEDPEGHRIGLST
jgi:predicted enzyme related to lactoylglutathione lyase